MTVRQPSEFQERWLEKIDSEDRAAWYRRNYGAEPTDFVPQIEATEFWKRYHVKSSNESDECLAQINLILNIYSGDTENNPETKLLPEKGAAPALLNAAAKSLNKAVAALKRVETNPYAASAVLSQLSAAFPEADNEDQRINEMNLLLGKITSLANILTGAANQCAYSDGLPNPSAGHPTNPYLDLTILKLATVLKMVIQEFHCFHRKEPLRDNARVLSTSAIARHIVELLRLVRVVVEPKTIENRLYNLKGIFPA